MRVLDTIPKAPGHRKQCTAKTNAVGDIMPEGEPIWSRFSPHIRAGMANLGDQHRPKPPTARENRKSKDDGVYLKRTSS